MCSFLHKSEVYSHNDSCNNVYVGADRISHGSFIYLGWRGQGAGRRPGLRSGMSRFVRVAIHSRKLAVLAWPSALANWMSTAFTHHRCFFGWLCTRFYDVSSSTMSVLPAWVATCSGVLPHVSQAFVEALTHHRLTHHRCHVQWRMARSATCIHQCAILNEYADDVTVASQRS